MNSESILTGPEHRRWMVVLKLNALLVRHLERLNQKARAGAGLKLQPTDRAVSVCQCNPNVPQCALTYTTPRPRNKSTKKSH